ncbi:adenylyl-sulfate kinase [Pedobacter petrophilus]|uniref:Adenylyl-sulfate kinase n=1 Tax=Pedobacter petrophilus TaxID=1908241 RepID=A0A7K0G254_9SPHI|nr:adenylyl-sulfate kinase [Pedobacter petrophilus]MRX77349.1 adenylyl-sulfate kinase [Pedobacter petrophilus]
MLSLQITGLSGAGKTTLAQWVSCQLIKLDYPCIVIDGDSYRQTLCSDLGFSHADRMENIRRLGKLANDYAQQGTIAIVAAINPFETVRRELNSLYNTKTVWVDCPMDTLVARDIKGLYRKALLPDGHPDKILNLTGVNDVYEKPLQADLRLDTDLLTLDAAGRLLLNFILAQVAPA